MSDPDVELRTGKEGERRSWPEKSREGRGQYSSLSLNGLVEKLLPRRKVVHKSREVEFDSDLVR